MNYTEEKDRSKVYKQIYLDGIEYIIDERQKQAEKIRGEYIKKVFENPEKYRADLKKMLGWPLASYTSTEVPLVKSELISAEEGYEIYRMQFEILPGLKMTGLFFKVDGEGKKPLVIVQHGGLGTPEFIAGLYGVTDNYNDMLWKVRMQGVHVFAPQLLLWAEGYEVPFNRVEIDAKLKRVGSSITAIEVFGITKILDYFENEPYVKNFGMVGMSYGGFYTLFTAALDTRIKAAISCAFFHKRDSVPQSDWVWQKSAEKFDDAEVACMIYPRKLCIEIADGDPLFDYKKGEEAFEKIKNLCKAVGTDWVDFIVFEGKHEFCPDDEPIRKLAEELKKE